jgi:L-asparaginase
VPEPDLAPTVAVYALGGTIAMTSAAVSVGVAPTLSAEQLVAAVPGLTDAGIALDVVTFRQLPGASLTFADIAELVRAIAERDPADGVVITQGTDTIEETAYLIDLLHHGPNPVVVTGAMRNPTLAGADGPANVLAAIQAAASLSLRGQGCVVAFADEIHAARRVRKTHTTSTATFRSPGGPLAVMVEGNVRVLNRLEHRTFVPLPSSGIWPRVGLVTVTFDDDGDAVEALASRVDGLVVAALGAGHIPQQMVAMLESVAARIPVVLASRTGGGSVLSHTYGFPGSESDLLARGLVSAGMLDSLKARVLLRVLLAVGADRAVVAAAFAVAGVGAAPDSWPWSSAVAVAGVGDA